MLRGVADEFVEKITTALDFLNGICLPDGDIPLFNDSARGIAPTPSQIFEYAERVIGYKLPQRSTSLTVSAFSESGYYVCRKAGDIIIIDCGSIGPDYNPAHAHCDTLSYELAIDGQRVVVDSGVFDYEPSRERAYARSTRAHNTA
ncbi:MAG TPA: heparinase, partial [Nitrospira sp.]|nr:heparinase [Nitrospira sp.]